MSRASAGMKEKSMKRGRREGMCRKGEQDEHAGENDAIRRTVSILLQHIIELIQYA